MVAVVTLTWVMVEVEAEVTGAVGVGLDKAGGVGDRLGEGKAASGVVVVTKGVGVPCPVMGMPGIVRGVRVGTAYWVCAMTV